MLSCLWQMQRPWECFHLWLLSRKSHIIYSCTTRMRLVPMDFCRSNSIEVDQLFYFSWRHFEQQERFHLLQCCLPWWAPFQLQQKLPRLPSSITALEQSQRFQLEGLGVSRSNICLKPITVVMHTYITLTCYYVGSSQCLTRKALQRQGL